MWLGHRISYEVHGPQNAPSVVISHGFGSSARHFRKLTAALGSAGFRVYAPDLLGFGASEKPAVQYSPRLWAQQQADFLEQCIGAPAVLVGNSIGSQVAVITASISPQNVRGLILLNCAAGMNQRGLYDDDPQLKALKPVFLLVEFLLKQKGLANFLFSRFRSKENVTQILTKQVYMKAQVTPDLVELLMVPSDDPGALNCFVEVFTGDPGPRPDALAPSLDCPIQIIWGSLDQWTPINGTVANAFKQLAESKPQTVRFDVIPDSGHCPFDGVLCLHSTAISLPRVLTRVRYLWDLDTPDEVVQLALPWLRAVTAS
jgi:pimeloyl-ACP methyl ester carboxylesterase